MSRAILAFSASSPALTWCYVWVDGVADSLTGGPLLFSSTCLWPSVEVAIRISMGSYNASSSCDWFARRAATQSFTKAQVVSWMLLL